eukprot:CAMPEP_0198141662 /NCGR_PEP_ID=MMETSP1443-20131203/4628_1 /TAXON_ID=186043 /ORGANISM="Entomoneis sp., Strain CCMP2396" /LENGTH=380 /DNA_ID=CAMNT_0043804471 /DNA_START=179 /DNA_END=1321 /DNA_ORIENTATION=-
MKFFTISCLTIASLYSSYGFMSLSPRRITTPAFVPAASMPMFRSLTENGPQTSDHRRSTSTELSVWFFGGSPNEQQSTSVDDESCELVPIRIEKPSSNSRKIFGEIVVPVPLDDVWAILTDYDRLAVHVPNLVDSKIVQRPSAGDPGDGSFRCRLFQRGAQKIVGFDFQASVTMDMKEDSRDSQPFVLPPVNGDITSANGGRNRERKIEFKCVDSFFFNQFDGEWKVVERIGDDGQPESLLSYVVDVRPNGPVPVAALEWRIREDVPTNLRAVKKAAMDVGLEGVLASRAPRRLASVSMARNGVSQLLSTTAPVMNADAQTSPRNKNGVQMTRVASSGIGSRQTTKRTTVQAKKPKRKLNKVVVQWETWEETETMAAYLE